MPQQREKTFLLRLGAFVGAALIVYLSARYLLLWFLPFFAAYAVAAAMEPVLLWLRRRFRLKRGFCAAVLTLALLSLVFTLLAFLGVGLFREVTDLLASAPQLLEGVPELFLRFRRRLDEYCAACPAALRGWLDTALQEIAKLSSHLFSVLSGKLLDIFTYILSRLPQLVLVCVTSVLAVLFTSAAFPSIRCFINRQLPPRGAKLLAALKSTAGQTLRKWLRAELTLLLLTFVQLLVGFWIVDLRYPLLAAFLTTLVDALPIFGAGTVLIPWGLLCLLFERVPLAIALFMLYACVLIVRSIAEPRLMASQAGLPPIVSLLAIYLGFCVMGVWGMLLFPLLLLFFKQLHDGGIIHLWKET
ncbi:MAG: sporulation integral membrane protein YtvI [Oscillospiraceae bacterium]|nr:sporulation integral membrane protein YtvI [Oscillospiraceae bacterium]